VPEHVALIEKWQAWLERIDGELNALRGKCNVFNRVGEIVRANPAISQPGTFHDLIISGYGAYMCMGLRRLCEPQNKRADRKIVSVRALLEEFCEHPDVLSRQRIRDGRERVRGRPLDKRELDGMTREWDRSRWMGEHHIDLDSVATDISRLDAESKPVRTLVNKQLAHNDWEGLERSLPFEQIHRLLARLEDIAASCHAYLYDHAYGGQETPYTPSMAADWEAVLKVSWIPPSS
jgi:hypothetical protein